MDADRIAFSLLETLFVVLFYKNPKLTYMFYKTAEYISL